MGLYKGSNFSLRGGLLFQQISATNLLHFSIIFNSHERLIFLFFNQRTVEVLIQDYPNLCAVDWNWFCELFFMLSLI